MTAQEFRQLQEKDSSLGAAANGHESRAGRGFFKKDELIWTPPGRGEESEVEQLAIPKECRKAVLQLAPLAGHLSKESTRR